MTGFIERQELISQFLRLEPDAPNLDAKALRGKMAHFVARLSQGRSLGFAAQQKLLNELLNGFGGFDILQPLLDDPEISEIMVNAVDQIFIEKHGKMQKLNLRFDNQAHLNSLVANCFGRANRRLNEQEPIGGLRLADGSRVHAVLPPASPGGAVLDIRRFTNLNPSLANLVRKGSLDQRAADYLESAVRSRKNIFISGGTGSGKTTFLNALSAAIGPGERVVSIEDTAELQLREVRNLVRLEARAPNPDGSGQISLEALIRSALRLRPDRIIVGEIRGAEAYEMIQAMSTGHPGSMSTGHGNSPQEMLERISLMILMSSSLPWEAAKRLVHSALNLIVQLKRLPGGQRIVAEIVEICPGEGTHASFECRFRHPLALSESEL